MIHNGASVPFALGGVFYHSQTMLVAAQDADTASLCLKKYTWQQQNTEIMPTLFFCFEWPRIEKK